MYALRQANLQAILRCVFPIPKQLLVVVYNHTCGGCSSGNVLQLKKKIIKHVDGKQEDTSWHVSFQYKISGFSLTKKATTTWGKLSIRRTTMFFLLTEWNKGSRTQPWAYNSRENSRQNPGQMEFNMRQWNSGRLLKLMHKCIPDRILDELM